MQDDFYKGIVEAELREVQLRQSSARSDEPSISDAAAAEIDEDDVVYRTDDGILFPDSKFTRISWDPDIEQPFPHNAVFRYLRGKYRSRIEVLPKAIILDPDNAWRYQISSADAEGLPPLTREETANGHAKTD